MTQREALTDFSSLHKVIPRSQTLKFIPNVKDGMDIIESYALRSTKKIMFGKQNTTFNHPKLKRFLYNHAS